MSRPFGIGAIAAISAIACAGNFDTTRAERPYEKEASLGQEVFGVLCDRLGASVLTEDLEGNSYHALCHPDAKGKYADTIDSSALPPAEHGDAVARNLSVAKLEKLASRRDDLIRAFNVIAPDVEIDDPYPPKDANGKPIPTKVGLHTALADLLERLNPLYDSNPLESVGGTPGPLMPATTQALARVFAAMSDNKDAQGALSYIGGRKGYRPVASALGVIQPVLTYPNLRTLSQQSVRMLSPGGPARDQFMHLLNVVHEEMRSSESELPLPRLIVDDTNGIAQPNRPRENLEVMQNVLLATDPRFGTNALQPALIVLRDARGFARITGNTPGIVGSVPAPFTDTRNYLGEPIPDGLPDVDDLGRFVDAQGAPVDVDLPFFVPGEPRVRPADSMGRAVLENGGPAYEYIDTTKTLVSSLLRDVETLVDPDLSNDRETLMYALAGAYVLFGDREDQTYAYGEGDEARTIAYRGFKPDTSPIVELVHATGQILADPQSDDFLKQMIDLFENHEQDVARVIGVALQLKDIADKHPEAGLPRESNFWDQFAGVFAAIARESVEPGTGVAPGFPDRAVCNDGVDNEDPDNPSTKDGMLDCEDAHCKGTLQCPGLLEDMLLALTNPDTLELKDVYSKYMTYRDVMNYNPHDINGPAWNYTTGNVMYPTTPVDRTQPAVGDNRSMFQRSMQIVYDSTRTTACNKAGAKVYLEAEALGMIGLSLVYPDDGIFNVLCIGTKKDTLDWCDVYRIEDMTEFYLQSLIEDDPNLPAVANKNKARLTIRDECMASMDWATDMDEAFEMSSGITGLTTKPTHTALNRLVFFGADAGNGLNMPDLDPLRNDSGLLNFQVNRFISNLQEPMGTPLCAKNAAGVNLCTTADDTLRARNPGTLLLWEQFNFAKANRPVLYTFYKYGREDLFADLVDVVHFHLPAEDHGATCSKTGSWDRDAPDFNPSYCAESGLVKYEPMMAEQLQTDLIPALNNLIQIVADQRIDSTRYLAAKGQPVERRGTEVMAAMTRLLFDPDIAAQRGITYRDGTSSTTWSDGVTVKNQTTPFDMMAEAIKAIDTRFESANDFTSEDRSERQAEWRKARSQLVDQFLAVDGEGDNAHFRNPAIPKAIVMTLKTLREQLNAHCPDREKGVECTWAKEDMSRKVGEVLADPLFAAIVDLVDELRKDPSRVELERLAQYLLAVVADDEAMRKVLASTVDLILVLRDGQTLPPIFNVLSALSTPEDDPNVPGSADITLQLLNVLSRDADESIGKDDPLVFDRYQALEHVLANLVKPIDDSQPSETALEVLIDVAADVHRADSSNDDPLAADDYRIISDSVHEFLTDDTRGMEQLYEVVRGAKGN